MRVFAFLLVSIAMTAVEAGSVLSLTESTFDAQVFDSGKNAFVKFFAPWCGHCKAMAKDWESLSSDYDGSSSVLISEVDCTQVKILPADHFKFNKESGICSKHGVSGYPTIKYFMSGDKTPQDYNGARSLSELKKFTADTLELKCDVKDSKGCTDKEVKFIENMKGKTQEDRSKELNRLSNMKSNSMKPELKQWLMQRVNILKQLA